MNSKRRQSTLYVVRGKPPVTHRPPDHGDEENKDESVLGARVCNQTARFMGKTTFTTVDEYPLSEQ